jgi:hypothetical protein
MPVTPMVPIDRDSYGPSRNQDSERYDHGPVHRTAALHAGRELGAEQESNHGADPYHRVDQPGEPAPCLHLASIAVAEWVVTWPL